MNHRLDFIWSSKKDYNSLLPLYNYFKSKNKTKCRLYKIHKSRIINKLRFLNISHYVVIAYSRTYYRLKNNDWQGEFIYVDHGISPIKYYSYIYDFFFEASLLFYPGEIFKTKMDIITNKTYHQGLLGGFPLSDDLFNTKIDRDYLLHKYNLKSSKPVILYAPTWGSKKNKSWGLHNLKYLSDIDNLITIPHTADYKIAKFFKKIIIPQNRQELNSLLHLSDIVISDISSIILEAALIKKNTIQLILESYPGTFPNIDLKDKTIVLSDKMITKEMNACNPQKRPFKISFLDQDMIVDYACHLKDISKTIEKIISNPNQNKKNRNYWANISCWKFDGKTNERMYNMILNYIENKKIEQLN